MSLAFPFILFCQAFYFCPHGQDMSSSFPLGVVPYQVLISELK